MSPEKPRHGEPCNRCGFCCEIELCQLSSAVFDMPFDAGPCPALLYDFDGQSRCGLATFPAQYAPVRAAIHGEEALREAAFFLIGSGVGCDALNEHEVENEPFERSLQIMADLRRPQIARAATLWLSLT